MKLFNILMFVAFLLSVAVQYNDPDPFGWIAIYGAAAACCVLAIKGSRRGWLPALVGLAALLWIGFSIPLLINAEDSVVWADVFGQPTMKTLAVELTREIGGLGIVLVWMAVLTCQARRFAR